MPAGDLDLAYFTPGHWLSGVDEVGRGPLAGPVTACAVSVTGDRQSYLNFLNQLKLCGVCDSKKLKSVLRLKILGRLGINLRKRQKHFYDGLTVLVSICSISPKLVDRINVLQASLLGMERALESNGTLCEPTLIDGPYTPRRASKGHAIIKGDQKSLLIALSSIVAKEYRDQLMVSYGKKYPQYGFERHAGYPTKAHKMAIKENGPTPIHRKSFRWE